MKKSKYVDKISSAKVTSHAFVAVYVNLSPLKRTLLPMEKNKLVYTEKGVRITECV